MGADILIAVMVTMLVAIIGVDAIGVPAVVEAVNWRGDNNAAVTNGATSNMMAIFHFTVM